MAHAPGEFKITAVPSADEEKLRRYVRDSADAMGLRDWTFEVVVSPLLDNTLATVEPTFGRRLARITFDPAISQEDADEVRHVTAHELAHLHLHELLSGVEEATRDFMPPATFTLFWRTTMRRAEHAVDAFALAVAPSLPAVEW